jgi:hypothetical protein
MRDGSGGQIRPRRYCYDVAGADSHLARAASEDVAIGVAPKGGPLDADASTLTRGRSHRLETVDPALYHELTNLEQTVVDAYVQSVALGPTGQTRCRRRFSPVAER